MRKRLLGLLTVLMLLAAACSGNDGGVESVEPAPLVPATPRPAVTPQGEIIVDGGAPEFNEEVAVVGVAEGTTLEVRPLPGIENIVTAQLPATATGMSGLGESFETPDGRLWWLIRWQGVQGWIEPGAAYLGRPEDVSAEIAGQLAQSTYPSMSELATAVGELLIATEVESEVVIVGTTQPDAEQLVTSVVDVIGLGDDAVMGWRLNVVGDVSGGDARIRSVERIPLCARGVDDAGVCV